MTRRRCVSILLANTRRNDPVGFRNQRSPFIFAAPYARASRTHSSPRVLVRSYHSTTLPRVFADGTFCRRLSYGSSTHTTIHSRHDCYNISKDNQSVSTCRPQVHPGGGSSDRAPVEAAIYHTISRCSSNIYIYVCTAVYMLATGSVLSLPRRSSLSVCGARGGRGSRLRHAAAAHIYARGGAAAGQANTGT